MLYFLKTVSQKWKYWFNYQFAFYVSSYILPSCFPKGGPSRGGECPAGSFLLLTGFAFLPKSLIRRMAQSVVEVMEDAKGKVQENLLANGGRSLKRAYGGPSPAHPSPFVVPAVATQEG